MSQHVAGTSTSFDAVFLALQSIIVFLPDWNSLDSVRRVHSRLELGSIVFFGLLAAAEAFAHRSNDERRKYLLDALGIVFFVIAVLAESVGYPYGQRNDTLSAQIIGSLDSKAQSASDKAAKAMTDSGTASTKAELASNSANAAGIVAARAEETASQANTIADKTGKKADALIARVSIASSKLETIENAVRVQGPRWRLLDAGRSDFIKSMKPFKGQKYAILSCGRLQPEANKLEERLTSVLSSAEAGWILLSSSISFSCIDILEAGGILVEFSTGAPDKVKDAGNAMAAEFQKLSITASTFAEDKGMIFTFQTNRESLDYEDLGLEILSKDPSSVVIIVGANPQVDYPSVYSFDTPYLGR